jgi:hypothetical protein
MATKITWYTTVIETYSVTVEDDQIPTDPGEFDSFLADNEDHLADSAEVTGRDVDSREVV